MEIRSAGLAFLPVSGNPAAGSGRRRHIRLLLLICLGLAGIAAAVPVVIYLWSEAKLRDVPDVPAFDFPVPADAAALEHGRHVARTRGCFGCHGQKLEGKNFDEQWDWPVRAIAPNLALYTRENDIAVFEAAVRHGIGKDGRGLMSMPAFNFTRLSDEDVAAMYAYMRSAPVAENDMPKPRLGWAPRIDLIRGAEPHMADLAMMVPELGVDPVSQPQLAAGEYLAMTMCNECHGFDVRGQSYWGPPTPDLMIASAYSREDFATVIQTGKAGDRELGLMALVGPDRFPELTEEEIDALYAYLSTLIDEPVAEDVFWRPER